MILAGGVCFNFFLIVTFGSNLTLSNITMTVKKEVKENPTSESKASVNSGDSKKCFVIMPISNHTDYETGHFDRVYEEIIRPAVEQAGFEPKRADDIKQTHIIIIDILKSIVDSDMAICDLSSLNPNVMYELGIRQMTKKPVVLIKDSKTKRIFDIGILSVDLLPLSGHRVN
jgi:hypothetical protein